MIRLIPAMLFMLLVASIPAQSQQSMNMELFDHFEPQESEARGPNSALWGYTASDGREYALLGTFDGVRIVDITEKPIRQVAYIWGPGSYWREIKIYKHFAYIVTESGDSGAGLQIVDLSALPASASLVRTDSTVFQSSVVRTHTVYIRDHYLYMMGTQPQAGARGGAIIVDLEPDPIHPRRVGQVDPYYFHDAWVRNDTLLGAAMFNGGCDIFDIRDRSNPKRLAQISYPGSGTHNCELTQDGKYVATTDEIGATQKTLKIWDISDLENITRVAEYSPNLNDIVHNVHFSGRYAVVAWYTAGVRIIDMIDPPHPREVGFYDTYPGASGGYNGVWEVYPYFPSGKIIASDRQTGLYVMTFDTAVAGSLSGIVRNSVTGEPIPGARIYLQGSGGAIVADASGRYYIGGVKGGNITFRTNEFGYAGTFESHTLTGDEQRDLLLTPLPMDQLTIEVVDTAGHEIPYFSYAVEPYLHSMVAGDLTWPSVYLPRDSVFTITVGKWGFEQKRIVVTAGAVGSIRVTLRRKYIDDATLDLGWSYESPEDRAIAGRWTRTGAYATTPPSDWLFPPSQPTGEEGYLFMTGAEPQFPPANFSDINGGSTTLTSPVMDLTDHSDPSIWFDLWYVQYPKDTVRDTMLVQLSNDNGATWVTAYSETETGGNAEWKRRAIFPKDFLPLTATMRIRFRASDTLGNAAVVAAIDNFEVNGTRAAGVGGETETGRNGEGAEVAMRVVPNPAHGDAVVVVQVPVASRHLRLELFNSLGERVRLLYDGPLDAGEHRFSIGEDLPSGRYVLRAINGEGSVVSRGVTVVR
jgi:choice-of-anchor B domain-containing protein